MNNVKRLTVLICYLTATICFGQDHESYRNCSAAFLGNKMVVSEYTPTGKCVVPITATGELTVNTVDLSMTDSKAVDRIAFRIAIRDKETKTLFSFSGEEFKKVDIQKVLARCKKGDHIVLLTVNDQYALPHNEILVN